MYCIFNTITAIFCFLLELYVHSCPGLDANEKLDAYPSKGLEKNECDIIKINTERKSLTYAKIEFICKDDFRPPRLPSLHTYIDWSHRLSMLLKHPSFHLLIYPPFSFSFLCFPFFLHSFFPSLYLPFVGFYFTPTIIYLICSQGKWQVVR